jgi:hypothetical protein
VLALDFWLQYYRPPHGLLDSAPVLVTPWHPVLFAGEWSFPANIRSPSPIYMDCVYNVVLSTRHIIIINDLKFITLGHGNVSHPVLAHAFFGTKVCACLSCLIMRRMTLGPGSRERNAGE